MVKLCLTLVFINSTNVLINLIHKIDSKNHDLQENGFTRKSHQLSSHRSSFNETKKKLILANVSIFWSNWKLLQSILFVSLHMQRKEVYLNRIVCVKISFSFECSELSTYRVSVYIHFLKSCHLQNTFDPTITFSFSCMRFQVQLKISDSEAKINSENNIFILFSLLLTCKLHYYIKSKCLLALLYNRLVYVYFATFFDPIFCLFIKD